MKYLMAKGYKVIPVNPGQAGKELLGQKVYASLADIEEPVDVVDIFRTPDAALPVAREAIAIGAKVVWMQLGVRNDEAAKLAEDAGLKVVMNRCPKIEYGRLSGEIGWVGVNRRVIDNRKPLLFGKGGTMKHRSVSLRARMRARLRAGLGALVAAVLLGPAALSDAEAEDELPPKPAFVAELQKAVGGDDKAWLASHLHYPVRYYGPKAEIIRSKAWFLRHYAAIFGPELKASVLAEDPYQVFENWQGLMIGEGSRNIWVRNFGADLEPKFEIVTINNSK